MVLMLLCRWDAAIHRPPRFLLYHIVPPHPQRTTRFFFFLMEYTVITSLFGRRWCEVLFHWPRFPKTIVALKGFLFTSQFTFYLLDWKCWRIETGTRCLPPLRVRIDIGTDVRFFVRVVFKAYMIIKHQCFCFLKLCREMNKIPV